jgi:hypothetical protein
MAKTLYFGFHHAAWGGRKDQKPSLSNTEHAVLKFEKFLTNNSAIWKEMTYLQFQKGTKALPFEPEELSLDPEG